MLNLTLPHGFEYVPRTITTELRVCDGHAERLQSCVIVVPPDVAAVRQFATSIGAKEETVAFLDDFLVYATVPSNTLGLTMMNKRALSFTVKNGSSCNLRTMTTETKEISIRNQMQTEYRSSMFNHLRNLMPAASYEALRHVIPKTSIERVYSRFETNMANAYTIVSNGSKRIGDYTKELEALIALAGGGRGGGGAAAGFLSDHADDMLAHVSIAIANWLPGAPRAFHISIGVREPSWYERGRALLGKLF